MAARRTRWLSFPRPRCPGVRTWLVLGFVLVFALGDQLSPLRLVVGRLLRPAETAAPQREEEEECKSEGRLAVSFGGARRLARPARPASHASLVSLISPHPAAPFAVASALFRPAHQSPFHRLPRHGEGIPLRC